MSGFLKSISATRISSSSSYDSVWRQSRPVTSEISSMVELEIFGSQSCSCLGLGESDMMFSRVLDLQGMLQSCLQAFSNVQRGCLF